jgi:hypothetical protein
MKEHFRDSDRRFWQRRLTCATVGCQVLAALERRQFRDVSATSPYHKESISNMDKQDSQDGQKARTQKQ